MCGTRPSALVYSWVYFESLEILVIVYWWSQMYNFFCCCNLVLSISIFSHFVVVSCISVYYVYCLSTSLCVFFSVSYSGTQDITTTLYQHIHLERSRTFTWGSQKSCSQPKKTFLMILVLALQHLKCDFENFYPGISVFGSLENDTFCLSLLCCYSFSLNSIQSGGNARELLDLS